jgi:hypothetical protein
MSLGQWFEKCWLVGWILKSSVAKAGTGEEAAERNYHAMHALCGGNLREWNYDTFNSDSMQSNITGRLWSKSEVYR